MRFESPFCYICLKNSKTLKKIESLDTDNIYIRDKLNFCVFMEEKSYYKIPLYICQKCHEKLNIAFDFREMGLKSNDILSENIRKKRLKINIKDINQETNKQNPDYKYNNGSVATSSSSSIISNLDTNHFDNIIKSNEDINQPINELNPIIKIKEGIMDVALLKTENVIIESNQHYLGNIFQNKIKTEIDDTSDINTVILEYSDKTDVGNNLMKNLKTESCSENPSNINLSELDLFQKVERELEIMFTDTSENINQLNTEYITPSNTEYIYQSYMEYINQLNTEYINQSNMENFNQSKTEKSNESLNGPTDISDEEFFDDYDEISDDQIQQNNLRCDVCNVVFNNEASLAWHLQIHKNLLAFKESQNNTIKTKINT